MRGGTAHTHPCPVGAACRSGLGSGLACRLERIPVSPLTHTQQCGGGLTRIRGASGDQGFSAEGGAAHRDRVRRDARDGAPHRIPPTQFVLRTGVFLSRVAQAPLGSDRNGEPRTLAPRARGRYRRHVEHEVVGLISGGAVVFIVRCRPRLITRRRDGVSAPSVGAKVVGGRPDQLGRARRGDGGLGQGRRRPRTIDRRAGSS